MSSKRAPEYDPLREMYERQFVHHPLTAFEKIIVFAVVAAAALALFMIHGCGSSTSAPTPADCPTAVASPTPTPTPNPLVCCLGDANKDGVVDLSDFDAVRANFGTGNSSEICVENSCLPYVIGDANCNGFVNSDDFAAIETVLQRNGNLPCACAYFTPPSMPVCQ